VAGLSASDLAAAWLWSNFCDIFTRPFGGPVSRTGAVIVLYCCLVVGRRGTNARVLSPGRFRKCSNVRLYQILATVSSLSVTSPHPRQRRRQPSLIISVLSLRFLNRGECSFEAGQSCSKHGSLTYFVPRPSFIHVGTKVTKVFVSPANCFLHPHRCLCTCHRDGGVGVE